MSLETLPERAADEAPRQCPNGATGVRPRVLSVVHYPHMGGPQNRNRILARHFADTGAAEMAVLLPDTPGPAADALRAAGVAVLTCRLGRLRASRDPRVQLATALGWPGDVARLVRAIRESGANVVLVNGLANAQGALAARLAGAGLVWQVLDTRTPPAIARLTVPLVRRWADAVMTTGRRVAELHFGKGDDLDGRLVPFLPPVDAARVPVRSTALAEARARARRELGLGVGPVVGAIANLTPQKGHPAFLRAAVRLRTMVPSVRFLWLGGAFAGQEAYAARLMTEAGAYGLEVGRDLIVREAGGRVAELAPAMDVAWTTSEPRSEGVPTACGEAMALAIPPVAFDVGGLRDLIRDGVDGRLVPAQDTEALARATAVLFSDPGRRAALGRAARARALSACGVTGCARAHLAAFRLALAAREARDGRR